MYLDVDAFLSNRNHNLGPKNPFNRFYVDGLLQRRGLNLDTLLRTVDLSEYELTLKIFDTTKVGYGDLTLIPGSVESAKFLEQSIERFTSLNPVLSSEGLRLKSSLSYAESIDELMMIFPDCPVDFQPLGKLLVMEVQESKLYQSFLDSLGYKQVLIKSEESGQKGHGGFVKENTLIHSEQRGWKVLSEDPAINRCCDSLIDAVEIAELYQRRNEYQECLEPSSH